jgi:hypothetical protein
VLPQLAALTGLQELSIGLAAQSASYTAGPPKRVLGSWQQVCSSSATILRCLRGDVRRKCAEQCLCHIQAILCLHGIARRLQTRLHALQGAARAAVQVTATCRRATPTGKHCRAYRCAS